MAVAHRVHKIRRGQAFVLPEVVDAACEGIVHHRVVFIAAQPVERIHPDLTEQINVGLDRLDRCAQRTDKAVGNLVADVETDAVDIPFPRPVAAEVGEIFHHLGIVGIVFK